MKRWIATLTVLAAPALANAQTAGVAQTPGRVQQLPETPSAPRLRFAPWLGVGVPLGSAARGVAVNDLTPVPVLVGGDIAWGPSLSWDLGLSFFTGIGLGEPGVCPEPRDSCSLSVGGQVALRGRFYLRPAERINPWLGLGVGYEVLGNTSQTTTSDDQIIFSSTTTTRRSDIYSGPVFAMLQAGVDFRLKRSLTLGGLAGFSLARFSDVKHTTSVDGESAASSSSALAGAPLHEWLFLAANVTFDVRL